MGSAMSALLETASGTSKKAQDSGQGAPSPPATGTEKKQQGEPSTPTPPPPPTTSQQVLSVDPHNFSKIVSGKDGRSSDELLGQVQSKGIYLLDGNTMKYWVVDDKRTNRKVNCFMLFARGLSIIWGSDQRYWCWRKLPGREPEERTEETAGDTETDIEVACLEDVCWLEIRGCLEMSYLSPGVTYDVAFVAKLAPNAYGWSVPVDLQLKIPNRTSPTPVQKERKVNLWRMEGKKNKKWTELKVGEVEVPQAAAWQKEEKVEIAMLRLGGEWKSGLELMGIKITPHL